MRHFFCSERNVLTFNNWHQEVLRFSHGELHDRATHRNCENPLQISKTKFHGRVISRRDDVNWPPRSCDLTPLDFSLWGFLKGKVYANDPQTIPEAKKKLEVPLMKLVRNYAKMSLKILSKE